MLPQKLRKHHIIFTCQSKSFISIFFTWQVSACELQPFSCHDLANDIYSQSAKTVFSHLNGMHLPHSSNLTVSTFIHFLIGTDLKKFPVWISCHTMLSNVLLSWYLWSSGTVHWIKYISSGDWRTQLVFLVLTVTCLKPINFLYSTSVMRDLGNSPQPFCKNNVSLWPR